MDLFRCSSCLYGACWSRISSHSWLYSFFFFFYQLFWIILASSPNGFDPSPCLSCPSLAKTPEITWAGDELGQAFEVSGREKRGIGRTSLKKLSQALIQYLRRIWVGTMLTAEDVIGRCFRRFRRVRSLGQKHAGCWLQVPSQITALKPSSRGRIGEWKLLRDLPWIHLIMDFPSIS